MHIVQYIYVGNTVCTPRADERGRGGGRWQEVKKKKKRNTSDLSDGYRLGGSHGGKKADGEAGERGCRGAREKVKEAARLLEWARERWRKSR